MLPSLLLLLVLVMLQNKSGSSTNLQHGHAQSGKASPAMSFESRQRPLAIFIQIARGLSRSRSRVARGLWRPAFMSPEASGDSFESRERLWRSSFRSPEASRDVVCESREALTQLYCIRASRDSQTTSPEASGDLNDDRQSLSRLSDDFARGLSRL